VWGVGWGVGGTPLFFFSTSFLPPNEHSDTKFILRPGTNHGARTRRLLVRQEVFSPPVELTGAGASRFPMDLFLGGKTFLFPFDATLPPRNAPRAIRASSLPSKHERFFLLTPFFVISPFRSPPRTRHWFQPPTLIYPSFDVLYRMFFFPARPRLLFPPSLYKVDMFDRNYMFPLSFAAFSLTFLWRVFSFPQPYPPLHPDRDRPEALSLPLFCF